MSHPAKRSNARLPGDCGRIGHMPVKIRRSETYRPADSAEPGLDGVKQRACDIEVKRRGVVRRAKLYYMRELRGKAARIKEKIKSS